MQKLTQAQREQWAIDGYIRVEQALSPDQVDVIVSGTWD